MKRVALVPGDGIGVEVTSEVRKVLDLLRFRGLPLEIEEYDFGAERYLRTGVAMSQEDFSELAGFDALFMGAFGDPRVQDYRHAREILLGIRCRLDLYVNLRPVRLLHPRLTPLRDRSPKEIRFVVIRENTEGAYAGSGGALRRGSVEEVAVENAIATRKGVERILRYAFRFAAEGGYRSLVMADKHNAQRHIGDLWHRTFLQVAEEFPEVAAAHAFIDTLCMEVIRNPKRYGVIVTGNLFGDILSDIGVALQGGPGMAGSGNINPESGKGMFEPIHGSAVDIAGRDRANPFAALLSCAMMLEFLGFPREGAEIEGAVARLVDTGRTTEDLGGPLGTRAVGDAVCEEISAGT